MVIYRIEDTKTGKGYVGKTLRDFFQRKKEHLKLLERNIHHNLYLQNIFNKDQTRLKFYIIEQNIESEEELNLKEIKWIKKKGELNIHEGGTGGDTLSNHPNKEKIFKKRNIEYPHKAGKESPLYINLSSEEEKFIVDRWNSLKVPFLKEISNQTGYSTYICKRVLENHGIIIPTRHETQKKLIREGVNIGSRNPNFTEEQKEYIRKRYVEDWIGCKKIAKELGFKSESPILNVVKELRILRTPSEWTSYKNKKRKYKKYGNNKNTQ